MQLQRQISDILSTSAKNHQNVMNEKIIDIYQDLIINQKPDETLQKILVLICEFVVCKNGYIALIKDRPGIKNKKYLSIVKIYPETATGGLEKFINNNTPYGKCALDNKKKYEKINYESTGHINIHDFLSIPLQYNSLTIGQLGLANFKKHKKRLIKAVKPILNALEMVLHFYKINLEHIALQTEQNVNKLKNNFMANISHEMRTPLNTIIGTVNVMYDSVALRCTDEILQEHLSTLKGASFQLLNIINDILDISKLDAGKMILKMSPSVIEDIVIESHDVIHKNKNIKFNIFNHPTVPYCILVDSQRLKQILVNLIGNAYKFTISGRVSVNINVAKSKDIEKYKLIPLKHLEEENWGSQTNFDKDSKDWLYIKFTVIDTGCGIREEDIKKLFIPFDQLDTSTSRQIEGTGLGLAITKKLCELMHGYIGVKSIYGKGSKFFFIIPVKIYQDTKIELDLDILNGKNILIVDDNEQNLITLTHILDKYNISYRECNSGNRAMLNYINNERYKFDLGLIDLCMPEMDGNTLSEYIFKQPNKFPTIALSSIGRCDYSKSFRSCISKPYKEETLLKEMCSVLSTQTPEVNRRSLSSWRISQAIKINTIKNGFNILVVEDDIFNQRILVNMLKTLGYINIDIANNGKDAIEIIQKNKGLTLRSRRSRILEQSHYDIIFMDILMPEVNGVEASLRIKKMFSDVNHAPYIIAVSGTIEYNEFVGRDKFDHFILKPIESKEKLQEIINKCK